MGGVINVAIRFPDGRAVCHERWTNNMPHWFKTPKMFDADIDHINGYLALTRNNDFILDPYAPGRPQPVRNSEYGLIVWDFEKGVILDNNHYSSPVQISAIEATGAVDERRSKNFLQLAKAGRIMHHRIFWTESGGETHDELRHLNEAEAVAMADALLKKEQAWKPRQRELTADGEYFMDEFLIDPSPMRYVWLGDHSERGNWTKFKHHLIQLGFPMSAKDGLNAGERPVPRKRKISEQEQVARELFQRWKSQEPPAHGSYVDGRSYDGVRFEDAPKNIQEEMLKKAEQMDPETLRQMRFAALFG